MTLVSLISNEKSLNIPLLYEFKNKVKKHILIYDIEDKEIAKDIREGLINLKNKYNLKYKIKMVAIDEDKKKHFQKIFSILKREKNKLFLNLPQADSALTIIISSFILKLKGVVFSYDKFENNYNVIARDFKTNKIKNNLNLEDYMILMNYKAEKKTKENLLYKKQYIEKITSSKYFYFLRWKLINNSLDIKKIKNPMKNWLLNINAINNGKINKHIFLGEIFEERMFWRLFEFDVDDIWMNVKITTEEIKKERLNNEFDILMIKDNHIITVELKYGRMNIKPDELIYKEDSRMEFFGKDTRGIIFHITNQKQFSDNNILRAKENNIKIINLKSVENDFSLEDFNLRKRVFLLGGCDLEMVRIKKILDKYSIKYYNENLKWGAKLSEFKKYFNDKDHFFGIELIKDITPPRYYTEIDHHNKNSYKKSSLFQVLKILNIKPKKIDYLIDANDRGHIKLMKKITKNEKYIKWIRKLDRKAQGVTEIEEEIAKKIKPKKIGEILVVYFPYPHFSPVVDNLNFEKLLIYNDNHLTYYTNSKNEIEKLVSKYKKFKPYYSNGFFGFECKNAKEKVEEIINYLNLP
jgi:hypothetical protein